tara:strand:- start:1442 stop:1837 length:396 start_codon:yes stop_codon:yes gene_type:complete
MMIKNVLQFCLISLVFISKAMATETITAVNLGDVVSELNQKEVYVKGSLNKEPYDDRWLFIEENTKVYFRPTMLVRPSNLRRLKEGCRRHGWAGEGKCKIKALAELDTSEGIIDLIIFEILEADIPPKSEN